MKYSKEIAELIKQWFPYLERTIEEEWELIKEKKSELSSMNRQRVTKFCLEMEKGK